jgi:hypothetical protein
MFSDLQYLLVVPKDLTSSSTRSYPRIKRQFHIKDLTGKVLGSITEDLVSKTIHTFEDDLGNRLGETRYGSNAGWNRVKISIYDSLNILCGNIVGGAVKNTGWRTTTIPAFTLEDTLGHRIAITDSFNYKTPIGHVNCLFENLRKDGLNIRAPDGETIATLKAGSTFDAIQIDLLSSNIDRLSILSLIITVIRMEPIS